MKIPQTFVVDKKNLEKKMLKLLKEYSSKKGILKGLSPEDVKERYSEFISSDYYKRVWRLYKRDPFTIEVMERYFKGISYDDAMKIIDYAKERKSKFLEGLADL